MNKLMSFLEGVSFSKSNPYVIVQQSKVNALCTMCNRERLQLLLGLGVTGTTAHDKKKTKSLGRMEENQGSFNEIAETLC